MEQHSGGHDYHRGRRSESERGGPFGSSGICAETLHRRPDQGEVDRDPVARNTAMNLQKLITDSICGAAANVFSTMLGNDLPEGQVSIETGTPEPNDGE